MKKMNARMTSKTVLSLFKESVWTKKPQRPFLEYRDLGSAEATGGRVGATVARAVMAYEPGGGTPRHVHELDYHLIYILKGWLRTEFEGVGEVVMRAGDCITVPGNVPQMHIEYSEDYEVLQVTIPGDVKTANV